MQKIRLLGKSDWKFALTGLDGEAELFGVNIFDYKWKYISGGSRTIDPAYHKPHSFSIYTVEIDGKEYKFASGELNNGVLGFLCVKTAIRRI